MIHTARSLKPTDKLLTRLALLVISLLFTVGCGDSSDDFVFTGTNPNNGGAQTGALTFNFVKAPSPATLEW